MPAVRAEAPEDFRTNNITLSASPPPISDCGYGVNVPWALRVEGFFTELKGSGFRDPRVKGFHEFKVPQRSQEFQGFKRDAVIMGVNSFGGE